ncbi:hypothetical protein [Cryptosporangium phraense]|uniref:MarR family transcriptional regulator n=1 Tax=Cryptosporangium phraense TaxID=2593070 RepID=A0A545AVC5_9ACTN|nr:hypothetical protein [Cryptosporangium phraense]TQS45273.1 hypothetical protein FL583_09235 [Cryptosporangium phraense]
MTEWLTLNALGLRGRLPLTVLTDLLSTNGLDAPAAEALFAGLAGAGLIVLSDGAAELTPAGTDRYQHLRHRVDDISRRAFAQFDPARVEVARSLLQEIADLDPSGLSPRAR